MREYVTVINISKKRTQVLPSFSPLNLGRKQAGEMKTLI
jgi:hypothetical protein